MPDVVLSAIALFPPDPESGPAVMDLYVGSLLEWVGFQREGWLQICVSAHTKELLAVHTGLIERTLGRAFRPPVGEPRYGPEDVRFGLNSLLERTPDFEDVFQVSDILWTEGTLELSPEPSSSLTCLPEGFTELHRLLVIASLIGSQGVEPDRIPAVVAGPSVETHDLRLKVVVEIVDHHRHDLPDTESFPMICEWTLPVFGTFGEFLATLDPKLIRDFVVRNGDDYALETMILYAYCRCCLTSNRKKGCREMPSYKIGKKFLKTVIHFCRGWGMSLVDGTIRTLGEVLANEAPQRQKPNAAGSLRYRGEDLAMRRDIDANFHLLFWWNRRKHFIEFDRLVEHDDYDVTV